jgi:siroheme synthase-like protein
MQVKNRLYPIFVKLEELELLLVGGGSVALEKLNSLLSNSPDAKITIVAPVIKGEIKELLKDHPCSVMVKRPFQESDINNKDLIVLATDDKELHKQIKCLAEAKGILVNAADTPDLCDFYLGSIVQKGNLKIAISTNGKSPTAAKRIKEVLNKALPGELDDVIENLHQVRNNLNGNFEYKVKKLNAITKVLVEDGERNNRWRKIATYSLLAFAFMLIGYFIFSYLPLQRMADDTYKWYKTLDRAFPIMLLAGFMAQLVDGALGMG